MRISVGERAFQTLAAKDNNETMSLAWLDDDFRVADLFDFLREQCAEIFADLRVDPPGAAVGDDPLAVQRAKICPRRDIVGLEVDPETERFDHPATNLEFERIITEETEMTRSASGSHSGRDWNHPALGGSLRERIEVRRGRRFEGS